MAKTPKEPYCGDVEVVVRMRYRLDADLRLNAANGKPTREDVLEVLQDRTYNDILDEEELEVLTVENVGDNMVDEDGEAL